LPPSSATNSFVATKKSKKFREAKSPRSPVHNRPNFWGGKNSAG
jgi:hypothetical protein